MFDEIPLRLNTWCLGLIFPTPYCDKYKRFIHLWTMNMNKSLEGWSLEDISMVDKMNYGPNVMQLVILHNMYIAFYLFIYYLFFINSYVMVCLLIADCVAPQFQMNKQQSSKNFSGIFYPNINPTVCNWWSLH